MSAIQKITNRSNTQAALFCDGFNKLAGSALRSNVAGTFASDFRQAVTVFCANARAAFGGFVGHVFCLGAKPKVVGIDAGGRVAPVQNMKRAGLTFVQAVGCAVGQNRTKSASAGENAVSGFVSDTRPKPAAAVWVKFDVAHESVKHTLNVSTPKALCQ